MALVLLQVSATWATAASEAKTLKIGALFGVTGFFAVREVPGYNRLKIAADMINEQCGITVDGQEYKIEIVLEDCKSAMDGVTAAGNKLIYYHQYPLPLDIHDSR